MDVDIFPFSFSTEIQLLARIAFAALVGGVIGIERRRASRPAGIRTMALVGMGSAAFTVVGLFGFSGDGTGTTDPARLAAQVVTGVGFIGAGTMIRSGGSIRGLTTAADIWVAASMGVAAGAGMYVIALGGAAISVVILFSFPRRTDSPAGEDQNR